QYLRDGVSRLRPHFIWPWRGPQTREIARRVVIVPDIIADARAAIFRATVGGLERTRIRLKPLTPLLCGVMLCEWYVINANHIGLQMAVYGYARVSTEGQTLAAQESALLEAGAAKVFKEKISEASNHRAQLHRLLKTIDRGDVVIVTRLDRLARSTRDLLNILDKIPKAGPTFKSLGDAC